MKVIDNFLREDEFKTLRTYISSTEFPWYFGKIVTGNKVESVQFVHTFYVNDTPTSTWPHIAFLRRRLNIASLIRVKVNLNPRTETVQVHKDAFHIDYPDVTTAVLYLNTCDGYTLFEDGLKVNSVENRMVIFDSNMRHTGTSCTNEAGRLVMNINYFPCNDNQYVNDD